MRYEKIMIVMMGLALLATGIAYAEDAVKDAAPAPAAAPAAAAPADMAAPSDAQSAKEVAIYGEVKTVNAATGVMTVQYYDYDSDEEKSADIVIASSTKLENVKNLGEVKQGDWLDVTYTIADGKNVALVASIEKDEIDDAASEEPEASQAAAKK